VVDYRETVRDYLLARAGDDSAGLLFEESL
jgi:hypothetical protein